MTIPSMERADSCKIYEHCRRCMHGVPHPPVIAVYDDGKRDYVLARESVCVARWASTNHWHAAGDLCGDPATMTAAGVDLCAHHADRLTKWRYFEYPEDRVREKTEKLRAADLEYEQAVQESDAHRERINAARSVVYYIRRTSDGAIKIGTTGRFPRRMTKLRVEHGAIQVLLTHSGTVEDEKRMHARFALYRLGRTEWFAPSQSLMKWICQQRDVPAYRKTQRREVMPPAELRKLAYAAPRDRDLQFVNGVAQWPPKAA